MDITVEYNETKKSVIIKGILINRLKDRITDTFSNTGIKATNGKKMLTLFTKMKYINWRETEIQFYSFFSLEIYEMFNYLAEIYKDKKYAECAEKLYEKTWISNYEKKGEIPIDLRPLQVFAYQPKDFQLEFVKNYLTLKNRYDLEGYILSFEQGLGKTFTAVALSECLHKEIVYIICPNSLKEVWAEEIRNYYKKYREDNHLFRNEVYISGTKGWTFNEGTTKFIIVNQESVPNIFPLVQKKKNSMIIVDESHNFRGLNTQRVQAMLELKKLARCKDNLLMSGTPIKAMASEIAPSLRMIDPHFTPKLAELYTQTFSTGSTDAANIANVRFQRVIYRKLKLDVLKLPEKYVENMYLKIPNPDRYSVGKVKNEIQSLFHEEYQRRLRSGLFTNNKTSPFYRSSAPGYNFLNEKDKFENIVLKYSRAKKEITQEYLRKIFQESEDNLHWKLINAQNLQFEYFFFLDKYVKSHVPKEERIYVSTRFDGIFGWAIAAKSATASAIGQTIAKYKNECFQEIWKYNNKQIIEMIQKNPEKTVIFSALVPTIEMIGNDLNKKGIRTVIVTGSSNERMNLIRQFKEDPTVKVLCASIQTLSTGVTLTEANQMFFFGTPYRSADFDQATDRIHRIGQENNCYIYNILLHSYDRNITGRIKEILDWSEEQFDSLMNESISTKEESELYLSILNENKKD